MLTTLDPWDDRNRSDDLDVLPPVLSGGLFMTEEGHDVWVVTESSKAVKVSGRWNTNFTQAVNLRTLESRVFPFATLVWTVQATKFEDRPS